MRRALLPTVALTLSLATIAASAPAIVLVEDGRVASTIVVPRQANPTVRLAAEELAKYLKKMSGTGVSIVEEGQAVSGAAIHVGATGAAHTALPDELAKESDGIFVKADSGQLILCGGSARGTLFAVYRFLEQALGCRWLAPDVEFVPTCETIRVEPITITSAPVFSMRTFGPRHDSQRSWGLKMGMNGFFRAEDSDRTGNGYYLPKQVPGCHAYHRIVPSKRYFADHPEWFPFIRNKRVPGAIHGPQLCVTASGLADEFAKNVTAYFDGDPNLRLVSISPNDCRGWCVCEACLALDQRLCGGRTTKQGLASDRPFMGDRVFWFANEVAKRVAVKHPDKLLLVLAYLEYAESPDTVKPAANVVPWLCHFAPADYSRPINDPTSDPNAQFNAILTRWAKTAPHLLFYSYVSKSMWWRLPRPVARNFAADVKHLHALGIRRYYCQSSLYDWMEAGPLYYVVAKLLWDPTADTEAIIADWTQHMFGPAAEPMREFYAAVERAVRNTGQSYSDNPPRHVPGLYDFSEMDLALSKLNEAKVAATDEAVAARVKRVADVFRYGYHMTRCIETAARFKERPTKALMREAMGHGEKALAIMRHPEAAGFVSSLRMNDEMGVLSTGFGDTVELGGRRCWNTDETGLGDGRSGWAAFTLEVADTTKPLTVEMDVWGKSQFRSLLINTGGLGRSFNDGGIWTPVKPRPPLSGKEQWDNLVFVIPPELIAQGKPIQRFGLGAGDSQIWVAAIRVRSVEP